MISENNKDILGGLNENINIVDSPETAQKIDKMPRRIKLAAATFKKATNWFKKQYNSLKTSSIKSNINKIENDLATKSFTNINDEQERKNTETYIYKKALKYEKLKDQLDLLIGDDKAGIPRRIDVPVEKRAINLRDAMMKALKYNGAGWVLSEEEYEDVFSVNDNDSQDSVDYDSISDELKNFKESETKENNIIQDLPINSVEEQNFDTVGMTDEEINESIRKIENEDLPINTVEEQESNTSGMTDEEINESMRKIGEYKAQINNKEPEFENPINNTDKNVSTEIKEDGTRVEISEDGKSKMFDFTNVNTTVNEDTEISNDTTKVTVSEDGKSKLYEFNTPTTEKETTSNIELDINELKDYRNQLAQLKKQRKAATEAKERADQERKAAEMAAQDARIKAQRAKESYLEKINKEQAEIEAINSDINTIASDTAKNNQAAKLANEYAEAIEQMISGDTVMNDDKGNSK